MTRLSIVVALLATCLAAHAHASTAEALSLEALSAEAEVVFEGVVTETESEWLDGLIVTRVTVEVSLCLSGECGESRSIVQVGGRIGDVVMQVSGSELLQPGEEVVLFATTNEHVAGLVPVGLNQGIFYVAGDELSRRLEDVVLVTPEGPVHEVTGIPASLSELRAELAR